MATNALRIDLSHLPADGIDVAGWLPKTIFQLDPNDPVKPTSDIRFDLHIERDTETLLLSGQVEGDFELECGRCAERFPWKLELDDYTSDAEIESGIETIDLTDVLRDDILVALPSYPRCEDGNVEPRECPAQGRFDDAGKQAPIEDEAAARKTGVWDALDQLKN